MTTNETAASQLETLREMSLQNIRTADKTQDYAAMYYWNGFNQAIRLRMNDTELIPHAQAQFERNATISAEDESRLAGFIAGLAA